MAGVSTATVSRVINQTAWVEPVTRERVEKAMRDLNYRRNAAAIALAKRSGDMLGLLTGNLADPFFARLARGVEDVSRKQQYRLMVCSGGHDEEMEKAGLDFLVNQGCEAIVVHASRLPDKELLRYAAHFPALVVVNRYIAVFVTPPAYVKTGMGMQRGRRRTRVGALSANVDASRRRRSGTGTILWLLRQNNHA